MVWARVAFGRRSFHFAANPTAGGLVTWGPYRFVRHPIYSSILLFIAVALVDHPTRGNAALAPRRAGGTAVRMRAEETLVAAQYPELPPVRADDAPAHPRRLVRLLRYQSRSRTSMPVPFSAAANSFRSEPR